MSTVKDPPGSAFFPVADPAPLGLAAFALTTFLLSGSNATFIPAGIWIGAALFYGGLAQLLAGMWEFRNRNVFGSTAFSTYGGFWMALGITVALATISSSFGALFSGVNLDNSLAWFLVAFAIFNTYMMMFAIRVNLAVLAVFVALEATEILLAIGFFRVAHGQSAYMVHVGGWAGIVTAAFAWYASAAGVINGMSPRAVLPVGRIFGRLPATEKPGASIPRQEGEIRA
jgi:succinate-acetate transporter protein